jgi:hypothetical protein
MANWQREYGLYLTAFGSGTEKHLRFIGKYRPNQTGGAFVIQKGTVWVRLRSGEGACFHHLKDCVLEAAAPLL